MSGFSNLMKDVIPFAGPILGVLGSIFGGKGKKQEYAAQQTPQQLALMNYLSNLGKQNIGQGAANKQPTYDAMNMISRMFGGGFGQYGQQNPVQQNPGGGGGGGITPGILSQLLRQRAGNQQVL